MWEQASDLGQADAAAWPPAMPCTRCLAVKAPKVSDPPATLGVKHRKEVITMGKPSKAALSKAGRKLASDSSSMSTKSKAGSTLGKG